MKYDSIFQFRDPLLVINNLQTFPITHSNNYPQIVVQIALFPQKISEYQVFQCFSATFRNIINVI